VKVVKVCSEKAGSPRQMDRRSDREGTERFFLLVEQFCTTARLQLNLNLAISVRENH